MVDFDDPKNHTILKPPETGPSRDFASLVAAAILDGVTFPDPRLLDKQVAAIATEAALFRAASARTGEAAAALNVAQANYSSADLDQTKRNKALVGRMREAFQTVIETLFTSVLSEPSAASNRPQLQVEWHLVVHPTVSLAQIDGDDDYMSTPLTSLYSSISAGLGPSRMRIASRYDLDDPAVPDSILALVETSKVPTVVGVPEPDWEVFSGEEAGKYHAAVPKIASYYRWPAAPVYGSRHFDAVNLDELVSVVSSIGKAFETAAPEIASLARDIALVASPVGVVRDL